MSLLFRFRFLLLLVIFGSMLPTATWAAPSAAPRIRYVPTTGHTLRDPVLAFYDAHDGATLFGDPLTEVITDGGLQVQYFTHQRVEIQNNQVRLTRLGSLFTQDRVNTPPFVWLTESPDPSREFFAASGHTLGGAFGWFWHAHGGLAVLGYPISEEYTDDQGVLTQYFERAQLTYHTEVTPAAVWLAPLGRTYADVRGVSAEARAAVPPIITLAEARMAIAPSAQHNVQLAAARLDGMAVPAGKVGSFFNQIGEVSTGAGYVSGQAISNGKIVTSVGGGICYVSTVLYRAVLQAGLDVVERRPHSIALTSFANPPGLDAAVDWPGADFRFRNDTANVLTVQTRFTGGVLVVRLIGQADGRATDLAAPNITRYPDGGSEVRTLRQVTRGGQPWKKETIIARYAPLVVATPSPTSAPTTTPQPTPAPRAHGQ